jgi:hypothetical protein
LKGAACPATQTCRCLVQLLVSLLRHQSAARAEFVASLEAAEAESERDGWHSAENVHAEMAALINEARCRRA